ncbi:MAG: CNNM domain-containing protein [Planctomycetota bacterium]
MSLLASLGLLALLLLGSAIFSGSETGFYSLSRLRVLAEARGGVRAARLILWLLRHPAGFLITLLVANNLCLELLTHLTEERIQEAPFVPPWGVEILVTLLLTPLVFFFGELLPKDLFRRRARRLYGMLAPFLLVTRGALLPVTVPLQLLSSGLEHLLGLRARELTRALGREQVLEVLHEGTEAGVLTPRAQELAQNVLEIRTKTVQGVLVPWKEVETVDLAGDAAELRAQMGASGFSRLPAMGAGPGGERRVQGYLLQLDLLAEGLTRRPGEDLRAPEAWVRHLPSFPPDLTVDQALSRLRAAGQRMALIGPPEEPRGIVTLKDLVQTISGELGGW